MTAPRTHEGESERAARYRQLEKEWQNDVGKDLLDKPYKARGSTAVFHRQFDRIAREVDLGSPGVVLEIGCGKGHLLARLNELRAAGGPTMVGMDLSRAVFGLRGKGLVGVQGDGEAMPIKDDSVKALIYDGALHHLIDYPAALVDAYRVLVPGGFLILFEPVSSPFSRMVHRVLDPLVFRKVVYESPIDQEYKDHFREERVIETLQNLGMDLTYERTDFLAYPLTGCYAGSVFGRSEPLMKTLLAVEGACRRVPGLRQLAAVVSWRFLVVARKPPATP